MVREIDAKENKYNRTEPAYRKLAGLSTDEKPTEGLLTGSWFFEVDTGDVYAYDEEGEEWNLVCQLMGGS